MTGSLIAPPSGRLRRRRPSTCALSARRPGQTLSWEKPGLILRHSRPAPRLWWDQAVMQHLTLALRRCGRPAERERRQPPMTSRSGRAFSGDQLARTRERFLTSDMVAAHQVRNPILASWSRSREWKVPADHIELTYVRDPDLDTPLTRSAMPVLAHLRQNLEGQPIS